MRLQSVSIPHELSKLMPEVLICRGGLNRRQGIQSHLCPGQFALSSAGIGLLHQPQI